MTSERVQQVNRAGVAAVPPPATVVPPPPAPRPSIGRFVHVIGPDAESNGAKVAPAVITRVWSEDMVNVTIFPDGAAPVPRTSVKLYADENAARGITLADYRFPPNPAFWPPRVGA